MFGTREQIVWVEGATGHKRPINDAVTWEDLHEIFNDNQITYLKERTKEIVPGVRSAYAVYLTLLQLFGSDFPPNITHVK